MGNNKNFHKLSAKIASASQSEVKKKLALLNRLRQQSAEIAEGITDLIANFRQIPHHKAFESVLCDDFALNLTILRNALGTSDDVIIHEFDFGPQMQYKGAVIFLENLSNKSIINDNIIKPLLYTNHLFAEGKALVNITIDRVEAAILSAGNVKKVSSINDIVHSCLSGQTILLLNGANEGLIISTQCWESRSVAEPDTEAVVRGPREGFVECLGVNIAMLRRKIKSPKLTIERMRIGRQTNTDICIVYLSNIANPKLIKEVRYRLRKINTDTILESGYIEQFIEDNPFTIFPTISNSERPDVVAAKILEGRAAVLVDGTPFVLTVPRLFIESFQSAEDYYSRPYYASMIRVLRYVCFLISTLAPAIYVALTTFHQELIPTQLLFTMAAAREGIPFPAFVEALIMTITFEILREAGVRLPRPVGQSISIVGALVIGEAAVSAGLIGAPMVIVVSITAVSSFVIPAIGDAVVILRFIYLILAATMGGVGILVGLLGTLIHLVSLRSFGTAFLSPIAPLTVSGLKDAFIRFPLWTMLVRPKTITWRSSQRQKLRLKPYPPSKNN